MPMLIFLRTPCRSLNNSSPFIRIVGSRNISDDVKVMVHKSIRKDQELFPVSLSLGGGGGGGGGRKT